jgi:Sulfite exporter TauE/SafE.
MAIELTPTFLGLLAVVVAVSGVVNGLAGFGFAIVGTMALATVVPPTTAVVLMLVPMVAANVTLLSELSVADFKSCSARFWPLIVATLAGTLIGMVVIDRLPTAPVRVGLGLITLGFVASRQSVVPLPSGGGRRLDGTDVMAAIGAVSGVLFGGTNVGVQLVAYLRSFELSHGLFVSVVALVFVGINGLRIAAAGVLGLYPSRLVVGLSVAAIAPTVIGVGGGRWLRSRVRSRHRQLAVFGLLTVIGFRLIAGGVGII